MSVNCSGYYKWRQRKKNQYQIDRNLLTQLIIEIHEKHNQPTGGYDCVTVKYPLDMCPKTEYISVSPTIKSAICSLIEFSSVPFWLFLIGSFKKQNSCNIFKITYISISCDNLNDKKGIL